MQVQNAAIPKMDHPITSQKKEVKSAKTEQPQNQKTDLKKTSDSKEQKEIEKTSIYLKVLSRLENMRKSDELPEKAIENFMKAVAQRLEDASDSDKKKIINSQEAKDLGIMKIEDINGGIVEGLDSDEDAKKVFALLKQPHFVELMEIDEKQPAETYGPNGQSSSGKSKSVAKKEEQSQQSENVSNKNNAIKNPKQAIEALKAMQDNAKQENLTPSKPLVAA